MKGTWRGVCLLVGAVIGGCSSSKDAATGEHPINSDRPTPTKTTAGDAPKDGDPPGASTAPGPSDPGPVPGPPPSTRSAGCGRAGLTKGFHAGEKLEVRGNERVYDVFVPPGYDPATAIPVVVVLHADAPVSLRSYLPIEAASAGKAIIVYPYGYGAWDLSAPDDNYDYPFIEGLRAEIEERLCVDKERVFAFGYSNGGFLANMLACYRGPSLFRAIAVNSGGLYAPDGVPANYDDKGTFLCPKEPVAALIIHSKNDNQVDYEDNGLGSRNTWLHANGCSEETTTFAPSPCVLYDKCSKNKVGFCSLNVGHFLWTNAATATWNFFASF
jgi:polyhydroxybutyrate depolymerase